MINNTIQKKNNNQKSMLEKQTAMNQGGRDRETSGERPHVAAMTATQTKNHSPPETSSRLLWGNPSIPQRTSPESWPPASGAHSISSWRNRCRLHSLSRPLRTDPRRAHQPPSRLWESPSAPFPLAVLMLQADCLVVFSQGAMTELNTGIYPEITAQSG